VYNAEISPRLPGKVVDCHVHVSLAEHCGPISADRLRANWALEVGVAQSWESLRKTYGVLLPDQKVYTLAFGGVFVETDLERNNDYVLAGTLDTVNNAQGLLVTRPEWDADTIAEALSKGFIGVKPYPDLAPQSDPGIYDFLPKSHLKALDDAAGILMLHLPRHGRLTDPDNLRELLEISEAYPRVRIVVAHIGRSFCLPTAKSGLPHLLDHPGILFDTAANLNSEVFRFALDTVGPDRLVYGSDLPITLMRGVREHVGDKYINYTDAPYSWNVNMKSADEESRYTYFLYEELRAIIKAVDDGGFGADAMEKIMFSNSAKLLGLGEG
jgi:uncharacterized protein